jgi:hypothetical protein
MPSGDMTNVMTSLPSASCGCGQPWEAHELRCPRPKDRRTGRVIALAVAGGLALQVLFIVALFGAFQSRPTVITGLSRVPSVAGPIQPRVHACELFYAWKKTHKLSLLNQAVADVYSSRVPRHFARRVRTDLSGLRDSALKSAHSPTAVSFDRAVQHDCNQITHGMSWREWPKFRIAVIDLSRSGALTGRSAGTARPGAPGRIRGTG